MARRDPLAGPSMSYGVQPRAAGKGGMTVPTLVLALLCMLLAVALGLALVGRRSSSGAPTAVVTVAVTPSATTPATPGTRPAADEPTGARDAVTTFLRAWREKDSSVRVPLLHQAATAQMTAKLTRLDPAKIATATPVGVPVIRQTGDVAATATQRMSDRTTVSMQLVFDPTAQYGWVVDSISRLS